MVSLKSNGEWCGIVHLLDELLGEVTTAVATHRLYLDSAPLCMRIEEVYVVVGVGDG